ncbi:chitinase [Spinellus fusiger]|nr:chitinase [Spinellus fusiger]
MVQVPSRHPLLFFSFSPLPVIAGYFINWAIYDRNFHVVDMAPSAHKLSHLLYAFANLNDDGTVVLGDNWADKEKHFEAEKTVNGEQDQWTEKEDLFGNLKQLYLLKQKHRQLKVSLSVGGWSWSGNYSKVAKDPAKRQQFAVSVVQHIADLGLDGVDIDWEFPKDNEEAEAYVQLLKQVRMALNAYEERTRQTGFLLTAAMPCGPDNYQLLHLKAMETWVNFFYLMAYDFSGEWDATTGHQAALYHQTLNAHQAVQYYKAAGVPSHKLVLGLPVYGRGFSKTEGPGQPFHGLPKGSWEKGSYDYKDLPLEGSEEYFDADKVVSWSFDPVKHEYITYDTPQVIQEKCSYILSQALGGAMFWELSADHQGDHPCSLLNTVYTTLGAPENTPNHLYYPSSRYPLVKNKEEIV